MAAAQNIDVQEKTKMTTPQNTSQRLTHSGLINQVISLQCPICYKFMTEPKFLSCGHTFCLSCLSNIVRKNEVICALCRGVTTINDGDASKLPSNIAFRSVVEEVANLEGRCDVCDTIGKPDDIAYCQDCNIFMCPDCQGKHKGKTENHNHLVNRTRRSKHFSSLKMGKKFCTKHEKETCVGICVKCNIYVCKECSVTHKHEQHEVQDLVQYATALHAMATPLKHNIKVIKKASKACIKECEYHKEKAIQHIDSVISQINSEFQVSLGELEENKMSMVKACSNLKEMMSKLSEDLSEDIAKCNAPLDRVNGSIQIVLDSPFGDMRAHNVTLESSKSKINKLRTELIGLMENSPNIYKDGNILNFQKKSKRETYVLGELVQHDWVRTTCPLTRPAKDMTCMAIDSEGKVLVGYFGGGVEIVSGIGSEEVRNVDLLSKVRVMAMSFGNDGNLVLRNIQNEISLYGRALKKRYDVKFETLKHSEGGDGDIALDTNNDIYASYRNIMMIHMYRKQGGKPCREIRCDGFNPQQILVMSNLHMVVMDAATIRIIDLSGEIKSEVVRKGHMGYPAIAWDGELLIAWVKPKAHSVELVKYTKDMENRKTLHTDNTIDLSGRTWYYCKVLGADKILFCCPKQLHIFTLHIRPHRAQSLEDDHLTVYEC